MIESPSTLTTAFLLATQNPDGGWGYAQGQTSTVETTSAVALSLAESPQATEAHHRALEWLRSAQHSDGGWGMSAGDAESGWPTAWALLALARRTPADDAVKRGIAWLLAVKTLQLEGDGLQREMRENFAIDPNLDGWPWLPGEASWVEPTALAMLALAAIPPTQALLDRLTEGVRYLEDRRCLGGGWNFGNPVMLGGRLPARAHPTAWALLALNQAAPAAIRSDDIASLRAEAHRDGGALALAWSLLALRILGQDDPEIAERLMTQQQADGSWNGNPFHTAVALLADRGRL
jgi:hypothetical protein